MGLFDKGGFFDRVTDPFESAIGFVGDVSGDVLRFASRLPNELRDLSDQLGNRIFDPNSKVAQDVTREGTEFRTAQAGQNIGTAILENLGLIAVVGGLVALIAILKK